jgi:purine-cytosine permease-like protein
VYVSDYTRYLREDVSAPALISWVYAGAALSAVWLMSLGALLASNIANADAIGAIKQVGDLLLPGFGTFAVLVSAIALITIMGVNAYGAMLTGTSAVDGFHPVRPTVQLRVIGLTLVGIVTVLIALAIPDNYLGSFNDFVILMLYFLVPWTAVNLVDFYFVRHGKYAITEIFNPKGIYGRWGWRGVVAYLVGFAAMVPFFATNFYVGPAAEALGGADMSFVVGLLVAGLLYWLFARNIDRAAEAEMRQLSLNELEGQAGDMQRGSV